MAEIDTTKQGAPFEKASPDGGEETTPKVEAKTYTQEELDRAIHAARSQAGRDAKSLELRDQALTSREKALKEREEKLEAAELEGLKNDPQKLDIHQQRKALREERAALEKEKAEHQAEIEAAREIQRELDIWEIGEKYALDPQMLKDLNLPLDQTEAVAKRLSEARPKETKEIKTDSSVTSGGGKDLSKLTTRQLISRGLKEK